MGYTGVKGFVGVAHCLVAGGALAAVALLTPAAGAPAASLEQIGTYALPIYVTSDPADPDRVFVVEQDGRIQLTAAGQTTTFLDLDPVVLSDGEPGAGREQGMLSMAFAPDYEDTGRLYVLYTGPDEGAIHVDELTASGDAVDPDTRESVITIPHSQSDDHYGGQLQIGPDGYLYLSTGDSGTCCFDPHGHAQNLESLLGKILRIDPQPGGGYAVPADNPFVGEDDAAPEIWSLGLRNPWRFSFDRSSGALVVADVGQFVWEEVNYEPPSVGGGRGDNFGWPCREGPYKGLGCPSTAFTDPVFAYPHDGGCAITGGYVVRDPGLAELEGRYVYGDFCSGEIRSVPLASDGAVLDCGEGSVQRPVSFGEDAAGRVYVASRAGPVYRLAEGPTGDCQAPLWPPQPLPPQPLAGPGAPDEGPLLSLGGRQRQSIAGKRRVRLTASAGEPATVEVAAAVLADGRELFRLPPRVEDVVPGGKARIVWTLSRAQARRARHRIRAGRRVTVRFDGYAIDSASNSGSSAEFEARLVLE